MLAEALEDRFGVMPEDSYVNRSDLVRNLVHIRRSIERLRPGSSPELNRATKDIVLFDTLHSPEDRWSTCYPFPRFNRINGEFENDGDRALSGLYYDYLLDLIGLLKVCPGDVLMVGSGSIRIPDSSRLGLTVRSVSDYFELEVRKVPFNPQATY